MTLDEFKKAYEELKPKEKAACPSCGHCPTCGRGGHQLSPWVIPYYPAYPVYPYPYEPMKVTWGTTCGTATGLGNATRTYTVE